MTRRLIGWLILVPLSAFLVLFALANRHVIKIGFDPLGSEPALLPSIELPLFMVVYLILLFGIILGGTATWFTQGEQRAQKRRWRNQAISLEEERAQTRADAHAEQNKPVSLIDAG